MAFFEAIGYVYDALQIATSGMDEKTKQNKLNSIYADIKQNLVGVKRSDLDYLYRSVESIRQQSIINYGRGSIAAESELQKARICNKITSIISQSYAQCRKDDGMGR